jgi:translocation protein SEC62
MAEVEIPSEFKQAEGLRTIANFLRSGNHGVKVRSGICKEKRVDYFKGKRMVECILEGKKWPKSLPKITEAAVAHTIANSLIQNGFFHRAMKDEDKKGYLQESDKGIFEESGYYVWIYAGNMVWSNIATGAVIAAVIGFTLLPIWPDFAKKMLWYFSVTFLIFTLSFCLIRFVIFLFLWVFGYEFWVFPRLFDESLSFQDSFKPIYSFEKGSAGQGYYRVGVIVAIIGFVYWACTQPTEFDGFLKANKDFIDDIYSGNLLADVAHDHHANLDRTRNVPNLEDLLREMAEEERIEATAHNPDPEEAAGAGTGGGGDEDGFGDGASSTEAEINAEGDISVGGEGDSGEDGGDINDVDDSFFDDLMAEDDDGNVIDPDA